MPFYLQLGFLSGSTKWLFKTQTQSSVGGSDNAIAQRSWQPAFRKERLASRGFCNWFWIDLISTLSKAFVQVLVQYIYCTCTCISNGTYSISNFLYLEWIGDLTTRPKALTMAQKYFYNRIEWVDVFLTQETRLSHPHTSPTGCSTSAHPCNTVFPKGQFDNTCEKWLLAVDNDKGLFWKTVGNIFKHFFFFFISPYSPLVQYYYL